MHATSETISMKDREINATIRTLLMNIEINVNNFTIQSNRKINNRINDFSKRNDQLTIFNEPN